MSAFRLTSVSCLLASGLLVGCGQPQPSLVGTIDSDLHRSGDVELEINGARDSVYFDERGRFEASYVPTGDVHVAVRGRHFVGSVTILDLRENERVEIDVKVKGSKLSIDIVRRVEMYEMHDHHHHGHHKHHDDHHDHHRDDFDILEGGDAWDPLSPG